MSKKSDEQRTGSRRPSILFCPIDEAFDPCDPNELSPIVNHLSSGVDVDVQTPFLRGTHLPDGRLDLCKQCIGPEGAEIVASAVQRNRHAKHWLLGANGLGDRGAQAVAETVRENSEIETVYLGCNVIGPDGAEHLGDALADNRSVTGFWLKRNPIGPRGAAAVARMLQQNRTIRTLDLVHTHIGHVGLRRIVDVLCSYPTSVRRLYLGGNRLDRDDAEVLAELIRINRSIHSLFLGVGRLGDDGAKIIGRAVAENHNLEVLSLSSNDIGHVGCDELSSQLQMHPSLRSLDLGYDNSTRVLGERPNRIGDQGCANLAEWIQSNRQLRCLDLMRSGISSSGATILVEAAEQNHSLVSLSISKSTPKRWRKRLRSILERNEAKTGPYVPPDHQDIRAIKSVYRA